jgi:hypothetical protein
MSIARGVASFLGMDAQIGAVGGHVDVRCVFGVCVAVVHAGQWCEVLGCMPCFPVLCFPALYSALLRCTVLPYLILACFDRSETTSRLALRPIPYSAANTAI